MNVISGCGLRRSERAALGVGELGDSYGLPHRSILGNGWEVWRLPALAVVVAAVADCMKAGGYNGDKYGLLFQPARNRTPAAEAQSALTGDPRWSIVMGYREEVGVDLGRLRNILD